MERRKFTREFKLEAVKLIKDRGVSYVQAGQDLGVHPTQLRGWVKGVRLFRDDDHIDNEAIKLLAPDFAAFLRSRNLFK